MLILSLLLTVVFPMSCFAELHLFDGDGNDLGILITTSTSDRANRGESTGYYHQGYRHMLFDPNTNYTYEIKTHSNSGAALLERRKMADDAGMGGRLKEGALSLS